jgi:hypothetical protein
MIHDLEHCKSDLQHKHDIYFVLRLHKFWPSDSNTQIVNKFIKILFCHFYLVQRNTIYARVDAALHKIRDTTEVLTKYSKMSVIVCEWSVKVFIQPTDRVHG